ncbi:hypothetical protein SBA4_220003 [Candidatus Sulfopaludibacter sp. SbA4]|nr:hypothetical protein SBA4_220003 [Candidatus Sulfopaludibacter sp. SbA4]
MAMKASTLPLTVEVTAVTCCGRMTPLRVTSVVEMTAAPAVRGGGRGARWRRMERALAAIPAATARTEMASQVPFTLSRYH